jgi:hypothetical protein
MRSLWDLFRSAGTGCRGQRPGKACARAGGPTPGAGTSGSSVAGGGRTRGVEKAV